MADYYRYLWSTTWPNLIVLFLLYLFVIIRSGWKLVNTWRYARDVWGILILTVKFAVWSGVLVVYTELFLFSQPDWFAQPGIIQGSVQGKAFDSGSSSYVVDIRSGVQRKEFYIDYFLYKRLEVDDEVKLMYLPSRREVIRCELLSNS